MNAGDVVRAALGADKALISGVTVFDVFEGGALAAEGKKSVAIEVTLQPAAETLTDKDIEAIAQKVIADVEEGDGRRDPELGPRAASAVRASRCRTSRPRAPSFSIRSHARRKSW